MQIQFNINPKPNLLRHLFKDRRRNSRVERRLGAKGGFLFVRRVAMGGQQEGIMVMVSSAGIQGAHVLKMSIVGG